MDPIAAVRRVLWNAAESRPRAPVRLVAGGLLFSVALVAAQVAAVVALGPGVSPDSPLLLGAGTVAGGVAVTLVLPAVARRIDRRPVADYGLRVDRDWWVDCGFGLALGVALQAAVFLAGWAAGWFRVTGLLRPEGAFLAGFVGLVVLFVVVGVYEEALFRGWLIANVAEGCRFLGDRAAVGVALVGSSVAFGLVHGANPGATPLALAVIVLAGGMLAAGYLLTGELAIPIGLHVTWNLAQGGLFGHGVSGIGGTSTVVATEATGPTLWTGGSFGPEGGLLGLIATLVGILAVVGWVRLRGEPLRIHPSVTTPEAVDGRVGSDD